MSIQYSSSWDGRRLTGTWMPAPYRLSWPLVTQAMGICFVNHQIVLVTPDAAWWTLSGGKLEAGETALLALRREVREEACAVVQRAKYLGAQRVDDPDLPDGPQRYYQTRFCTTVELLPFTPAFETIARRLIPQSKLVSVLSWGDAPIVPILLDLALACEARMVRGDPYPRSSSSKRLAGFA